MWQALKASDREECYETKTIKIGDYLNISNFYIKSYIGKIILYSEFLSEDKIANRSVCIYVLLMKIKHYFCISSPCFL